MIPSNDFVILDKPEFPDPYQRVDVIEGMNATINISVNAYPSVAWFSWTKDSTLIPPWSFLRCEVTAKGAGSRFTPDDIVPNALETILRNDR
ncbi:nephrin [Caerostris extrusa]|uniref:Nephrin n=1 Tax=Caerostris extrusa TaxID=172846 RepID=A0AAV4WVX5_CAEEX|nr:nephrin [Caerostris extrusa]